MNWKKPPTLVNFSVREGGDSVEGVSEGGGIRAVELKTQRGVLGS